MIDYGEVNSVGCERYRWQALWGDLPQPDELGDVPGVAFGCDGEVILLTRGRDPIIVLDPIGQLLRTFGHGMFNRPHGLYVDADNLLHCIDDAGNRLVVFSIDGDLVKCRNWDDQRGVTQYRAGDADSIVAIAGPACLPTSIARANDGRSYYLSDGYGNARIHVLNEELELVTSWGEPGINIRQFRLVHGVTVARDDRVIVCDRENDRVQVFDSDGSWLETWSDVHCPNSTAQLDDDTFAVAELGRTLVGFPSKSVDPEGLTPRVTIRDSHGALLATLTTPDRRENGIFFAPHGLAARNGVLLVGEVARGYSTGLSPTGWPVFHRLERLS